MFATRNMYTSDITGSEFSSYSRNWKLQVFQMTHLRVTRPLTKQVRVPAATTWDGVTVAQFPNIKHWLQPNINTELLGHTPCDAAIGQKEKKSSYEIIPVHA